jgi:hypothetical protein
LKTAIIFTVTLIEHRKPITTNFNGSSEGLGIIMVVPFNGSGDEENDLVQSSKLAAKGAMSKFEARHNVATSNKSLLLSAASMIQEDVPKWSLKELSEIALP